jgi:hypothetical protein
MRRIVKGMLITLALVAAASCDQSRIVVNGGASVDSPVEVRGSLLVNGPLTVDGPVAAARFRLNGPLIPNSGVRPVSASRAVKIYNGRLVINGPFEVAGALNVGGTLTVQGPLICDSTTQRKPIHAVESDGPDFLGFNKLQRMLGLPLN